MPSETNMGRCVVCGKTIDMRDAGHNLVIMEREEPDHPDVSIEDASGALADALRREGSPESHMLADAYESGEELIMHEECHDKTAMPSLYATEEEVERLVDE